MNTLEAIRALNALITLTLNATITSQRISEVIAEAQREGRDITDAEWQSVISDADAADERLAQAIEDAT